MTDILNFSPSIRLTLVFGFILMLIRKKHALGVAFIFGAAMLCLLFGIGPIKTLKIIASSAILPDTFVLSFMVASILIFSKSMEQSGQMNRMITNFKGLVRKPAVNLAIFPALIGLLPMPGGAIFSAPMVRELGEGMGLSNQRLSLINYWFRHIWEYWWPLYPGVLLAMTLSKIDVFTFISTLFPFTLVAISSGFLFILKPSSFRSVPKSLKAPSAKPFFIELFPVLLIIFGGPLLGYALSQVLPDAPKPIESGLIGSLIIATIWVWCMNNMTPQAIYTILKSPDLYMMVFMIVSILAFKKSLEASGAVGLIAGELLALSIPVVFIAVLLPLMVGLITGISVAFVGISLPVLIPLIIKSGQSAALTSFMILIMISGFCGVLLSPLHLCFILSNGFFRAPMAEAYKVLIPLCLILGLFAIAAFYIRTILII